MDNQNRKPNGSMVCESLPDDNECEINIDCIEYEKSSEY